MKSKHSFIGARNTQVISLKGYMTLLGFWYRWVPDVVRNYRSVTKTKKCHIPFNIALYKV